jgi:hypothetical protein
MPVDYSKLLAHPDKDEIISKLVTGIKPKDVAQWLKLKYKKEDQEHLHLSLKLLKDFLEGNLDLYSTLKQDIEVAKDGKLDRKISDSLKNNKTYQERIAEVANTEVDIRKVMNETGIIIRTRIEQYFDRMQENPANLKPDYGLIKWFELLLNYIEKYDKIINKSPDQIIQHNVTHQVIDNYVVTLQDAIRETLSEIDADAAFLFMEKLNEKLDKLQMPEQVQPVQINQEKRMAEAKILSGKVMEDG